MTAFFCFPYGRVGTVSAGVKLSRQRPLSTGADLPSSTAFHFVRMSGPENECSAVSVLTRHVAGSGTSASSTVRGGSGIPAPHHRPHPHCRPLHPLAAGDRLRRPASACASSNSAGAAAAATAASSAATAAAPAAAAATTTDFAAAAVAAIAAYGGDSGAATGARTPTASAACTPTASPAASATGESGPVPSSLSA